MISLEIINDLPVDWVGEPPEISIKISLALRCFFFVEFSLINRTGALPIPPFLILSKSVPRIIETLLLNPSSILDFPQSPVIVFWIKSLSLRVFASPAFLYKLSKYVRTWASKLSFI